MTLRDGIIVLLVAGVAGAMLLGFTHWPVPWWILAVYWGAVLAVIAVERGRYRPLPVSRNLVRTTERYHDPVSGEVIDVYVDPVTGERDYRTAENAGDRVTDAGKRTL